MNFKLIFLVLWGVLSFGQQLELQELWEREIANVLTGVPEKLLENKRVLFVGGFFNEIAFPFGYFSDNQASIEELGGEVSFYSPSSKQSISENAKILREHILAIFSARQPVTLMGHSKGAAEILYMLLKYPELVSDEIVEAAILIQGTIQGSPLANDPSRWLCYECLKFLGEFDTRALSESGARTAFDQAIGNLTNQTQYEQISKRVFYVRSHLEPEKHSACMKWLLAVVRHECEANSLHDGMVLTEAQMDPRVGVDLGVVKTDHVSLFFPWMSALTRYERKAFMRTVFLRISEAL